MPKYASDIEMAQNSHQRRDNVTGQNVSEQDLTFFLFDLIPRNNFCSSKIQNGIIRRFCDDSEVTQTRTRISIQEHPFDFGTNHKTKHVVFELHFDSNPKYIR